MRGVESRRESEGMKAIWKGKKKGGTKGGKHDRKRKLR